MTILYQIDIMKQNGLPYDVEEIIKENLEIENDFVKDIVFGVETSLKEIDEIANKITLTIKNKDRICKEYKKFRKGYSKKSKETISNYLGLSLDKEKKAQKAEKDELLMTVVVPVYNVENYLAKSLDSIIEARIDNMEILIINDGSTDNSEKIILDYKKRYPK